MLNATQISALAIACSLSYLSLPASAAAAPRDALFQSAQGQARNVEAGPNALRGKSRSVKIDEATLGKAHMRLNLGIGPEFNAIRERQAERRDGRKAWIGRVKGDKDSEVVLVSKGNAVAGTIRHNGRL